MDCELAQYAFELSEYAAVLCELKGELLSAQRAHLERDCDAMHARAMVQKSLCDRVVVLRRRLRNSARPLSYIQVWPGRVVNLRTYIVRMEGDIRSLNTANQTVIRGACRTFKILANAIASLSPTYGNPASWGAGEFAR